MPEDIKTTIKIQMACIFLIVFVETLSIISSLIITVIYIFYIVDVYENLIKGKNRKEE